ncbi:MAG TPA: MMPL family transporter, partial [Spirochaetia bacterium]|nr:MMPL family transporter [Spirochaetia bacterium]
FAHLDQRFGGNDLAMVAVESDAVFSTRTLGDIDRLTEAFRAVDGVSSVTSLTNVMDVRKAPGGSVETGKLIDAGNLPATQEGMRALRDYVMGKERYRGSLVSNDGRASLIIVQLAAGSDKNAVVRALQAAAPASAFPETLYFGGIPFLTAELARFILHDFALLLPIAALLIILTLFFSFGTLRGVLVPLGSVAVTVVWVLGFMSLLRVPLTLVSDIIPAILIAVGTAPCIHILSKYDEDTTLYGQTGPGPSAAFGEVGLRVILAAVTIVLGFCSFIIGSYLTTIRDFGIFTAVGVCFSLLISILLVPAVLTLIPVRPRPAASRRARAPRHPEGRLVYRAMRAWADLVVRRRTAILIASGVVLVAGIVGIPLIQRKADFAEFFDPGSQVRRTEAFITREFGGSRPVQIDFTGDLQNPFILKEMLRFERFLDGEGLAHNAVSPADFVVEMNDVMGERRLIPDDPAKVANLLFLVGGQDVARQLLSDDATEGQIQAMVPAQEVKELARTIDGIEGYIRGLDTRLVAVDLSVLPPADRQVVAAYRIPRAGRSSCGWPASVSRERRSTPTA